MNSKERVHAAMNHQQPDRVPVMCQLALGHYFLHSDYRPSDIWLDSEVFAKVLVEMQQKYGFDGILVNLPGRPPRWRKRVRSYEEAGKEELIYWASGSLTRFPPDDNPQTVGPDGGPLARADYRRFDMADPALLRQPGYIWNTWHLPELWGIAPDAHLFSTDAYPPWFTGALEAVQRLAPDISVHVEVFSPFTHLMELFGYEQTLMALVEAPDVCHQALMLFSQVAFSQIMRYAQCKPDAILVSSAFAGAGFISRDMYREFVFPYEDEVFGTIFTMGIKPYVHTCGAIGDRLDLMSELLVEGIDTLDPPPLGTVDLAKAKAKYGERFFFKGNLDAVNEMLHPDDEVFEEAVKERIRIGMPGGGYILSSACSVAPHVKPERLCRLVELAEEYGRY